MVSTKDQAGQLGMKQVKCQVLHSVLHKAAHCGDITLSGSGAFSVGLIPIPSHFSGDCTWRLQSSNGANTVGLYFQQFSLLDDEVITVSLENGTTIAEYYGEIVPDPLVASTSTLLVNFWSPYGPSTTAVWVAVFHAGVCSHATLFTGTSGTLDDGSFGNSYYHPIVPCSYTIQPLSNDTIRSITLEFSLFDLNPGDSLIIRSMENFELYRFTGSTLPPVIRIPRSGIQLDFEIVSYTFYGSGWRLAWVSGTIQYVYMALNCF